MFVLQRSRRGLLLIALACLFLFAAVQGKSDSKHYEHHSGDTHENRGKYQQDFEQQLKMSEAKWKTEKQKLQKQLVAKDHMLKEAQKEAYGIRDALNATKVQFKALKRSLQLEKKNEQKLQKEYDKEHLKYGEMKDRLTELEDRLDETIERAENPEITKWLTRRAEDVGMLLDSPRTGQILGESMSSMLSSSSDTMHSLESKLESNLSSVVAHNSYSGIGAVLFSYIIVLMPIGLMAYAMKRVSKAISVRQYILLCHLFNMGLVCACLILSIAFGEDPFGALYRLSSRKAILLMVFFALQFPIFLLLTAWASITGATLKEKVYFAVQAFLYTLVAYNYRVKVWRPVMSGDLPLKMVSVYGYAVYTVAIAMMIYFTVAAAKARRNENVVADIENLVADGYKELNGGGSGTGLLGETEQKTE